jgi:hypothetical protein
LQLERIHKKIIVFFLDQNHCSVIDFWEIAS